jgi:hypothetical protein
MEWLVDYDPCEVESRAWESTAGLSQPNFDVVRLAELRDRKGWEEPCDDPACFSMLTPAAHLRLAEVRRSKDLREAALAGARKLIAAPPTP